MVAVMSDPPPPYASGTGRPWTPNAAHRFQPSWLNTSSRSCRTMSTSSSARANSRAAWRSCSCSGLRAKSMGYSFGPHGMRVSHLLISGPGPPLAGKPARPEHVGRLAVDAVRRVDDQRAATGLIDAGGAQRGVERGDLG